MTNIETLGVTGLKGSRDQCQRGFNMTSSSDSLEMFKHKKISNIRTRKLIGAKSHHPLFYAVALLFCRVFSWFVRAKSDAEKTNSYRNVGDNLPF